MVRTEIGLRGVRVKPLSSLRSEKPMAWTTKSSSPHSSCSLSKVASMLALSSTSQGSTSRASTFSPKA